MATESLHHEYLRPALIALLVAVVSGLTIFVLEQHHDVGRRKNAYSDFVVAARRLGSDVVLTQVRRTTTDGVSVLDTDLRHVDDTATQVFALGSEHVVDPAGQLLIQATETRAVLKAWTKAPNDKRATDMLAERLQSSSTRAAGLEARVRRELPELGTVRMTRGWLSFGAVLVVAGFTAAAVSLRQRRP
jgi:hypothetical protein